MASRGPGLGYELFRQRQFTELWSANLVLTLGLVMLMLGVSWEMTSLTDNPVLVSMVQTVMSLPFVFFSVPLGVASDVLGHRTVLLASQAWMLVITGVMGVIALTGGWEFTPVSVLSLLFLVGVGLVAQQSAWKPFLQEFVPEDKLVAAISFNSLSNKISQTLGPILGGYLMGLAGAAVVLFTRALSHVLMIITLIRFRNRPKTGDGETDKSAMASRSLREGWNVLKRSPQLYGPMIRCALQMGPCAGVLALLPLEAKENIQTGAIGFGGLLAALGVGTTAGVSLMPLLQRHLRLNPTSTVAVAFFSLAAIGISRWDSMALDASFLVVFGFSWSVLTVSHQFAVQTNAPKDMRGLMTSIYALVQQGAMALGSFGFGVVAQQISVSRSILIAGIIAMSGLLLVRVFPMPEVAPEPSTA
ncbi:MFS transporter [Mycolicibacterium sp. CH28]|uniref:MFS transporter n=1 Tax=Mycolicibacterium sp. CH28 TaxID=2512237 RepID=UPI00107FE472|nr:MFS transporter [Mycolicibacterium sp. CH28]TGD86231.1 MFS transporter [Mycolicibacterium sp. CH28]